MGGNSGFNEICYEYVISETKFKKHLIGKLVPYILKFSVFFYYQLSFWIIIIDISKLAWRILKTNPQLQIKHKYLY
jgi:hypothetical protein